MYSERTQITAYTSYTWYRVILRNISLSKFCDNVVKGKFKFKFDNFKVNLILSLTIWSRYLPYINVAWTRYIQDKRV